jgi:hypothetical protein
MIALYLGTLLTTSAKQCEYYPRRWDRTTREIWDKEEGAFARAKEVRQHIRDGIRAMNGEALMNPTPNN